MKETRDIIAFYDRYRSDGVPLVLATVVDIEDSSYRRRGARMLIRENGEWVGGISGGCLEGDALKKAKQVLISGIPRIVTYDTREDDPYQIGAGLGCEGRIDVFMERVEHEHPSIELLRDSLRRRDAHVLYKVYKRDRSGEPLLGFTGFHLPESIPVPAAEITSASNDVIENQASRSIEFTSDECTWSVLLEYRLPTIRLVLGGDNYDIYPVLEYANTLGWEVMLIGKPHKLRGDLVKMPEKLFSPNNLNALPEPDPFTAVIAMSHDYETDIQLLQHYIKTSCGYLGLLGPKKRFEKIKKTLELTKKEAERVYNPVGLNIGSVSPEEIGLAMVAEVVKNFRGGDGASLSEKEGFIHNRN